MLVQLAHGAPGTEHALPGRLRQASATVSAVSFATATWPSWLAVWLNVTLCKLLRVAAP